MIALKSRFQNMYLHGDRRPAIGFRRSAKNDIYISFTSCVRISKNPNDIYIYIYIIYILRQKLKKSVCLKGLTYLNLVIPGQNSSELEFLSKMCVRSRGLTLSNRSYTKLNVWKKPNIFWRFLKVCILRTYAPPGIYKLNQVLPKVLPCLI